jgi:hypothetical protein
MTTEKTMGPRGIVKKRVAADRQMFDRLYGESYKKQKQDAANERRKAWQKLTPQQQLAELDRRVPEGAKKQRAKILAKIAASEQKKQQKKGK